jgi:hypothetical protein
MLAPHLSFRWDDWLTREPAVQPCLGKFQIAVDGGSGNVENLGGLFVSASEEESQFENAHFALVGGFELIEGRVEREHVFARCVGPLMQRNANIGAARRRYPDAIA